MPKKWTEMRFEGSYVYFPVELRYVPQLVAALALEEIDFHVIYSDAVAAVCVQNKERYRAIVEEAYARASY